LKSLDAHKEVPFAAAARTINNFIEGEEVQVKAENNKSIRVRNGKR